MTYRQKFKYETKEILKLILSSLHFQIEMMKDDARHKTATQRKNEAKKVILDKCCRDLAASIKKTWWQKAICGCL